MASSSKKKHDVFISFRGEDTRTGFTSHLHSALDRHKIDAYIDNNLVKGEDLWTELSQAIEHSLTSVVVFSRNYASSKWCLEELAKIMECRRRHGQVVIPVFYNTEPSHVRWQKESYETAFAKHERDLRIDGSAQDKLSAWKAALSEAANLSGWNSSTHRDESQLIQNIVNDVLQKLYLRYPNELEGLVGNDKALSDIESSLKKVQVIGIWGMGGIGKTTIAKVMFARHFPQYDSSCFLANVGEESKKLGLTYSREKLLFDILKEQIHSPIAAESTFVKRRIKSKKVFIVLDDVNSLEQLESLCGEVGDLGPDSRLIITTRDKQLLKERVGEIFELKKWNFEESLTLFSLNAFKKKHPEKGYEHLSERAVGYADGVPLALKVLGSYLYNISSESWEIALKMLKEYPYEKIQSVLKVSYDGLHETEKDIFLDIAFFFKEEHKDHVIRILDASGFYAALGIDVLVNKALITISYSNRIQMHDLLQEMGLDIVRQECKRDPGKRSRLRDVGLVCDVLKNKKGTKEVEGITLDLSQIEDLNLTVDTFSMMINLRFIRFHLPLGRRSGSMLHPGVLNLFSEKLRYFEWHGYPFDSLPLNFCAKLLVGIRMQHSNVKELWQGMQDLVNLEVIDLSECKQLMKLPDLSRASKLKWVYLSGCENLSVLHPSILSVDTLVTLILDRCKKLRSLKSEKHLPALERISVDGCSCLKEFSVSSDLIESLDLSNTGIQILHSSIGRLHKLVRLNLESLRLETLPDDLSSLGSLQDLRISKCLLVINKQKLQVLCDGLQSLKVLHLKDCKKLSELPDNIEVLSQLNELRLDGSNVERLPASIKHLQELEILSLRTCRKLRFLPELPSFIKEFHADNCTSLVKVSSLMSFLAEMRGKYKFISFKNCMKLDGPSLERIMESAQLAMMSATFANTYTRWFDLRTSRYNCNRADGYNYNSIEVCLAGSRIPTQFTYHTTRSSSITIQLPVYSELLGIIYCVILSPSPGMKKHGAQIQCQCYLADGTKVGHKSKWHYNSITDLNLDHIYAWYDPFHCDSMQRSEEQQVCFEFSATTDNGDGPDGLISLKECGVRLICVSDIDNCLQEEELNLENEGLESKLSLVKGLMEKYAEVESRLLFALTNGLESEVSLKLEFESHRRAILALTGKESSDVGTQIHYQEEDSCDCIAGATSSSSEDTPEEDDTKTLKQMIVSSTTSPDEPTSHLPTIPPFGEGRGSSRSSKQEGRYETWHVGGPELPLEVSHSRDAQSESQTPRGDVILEVGLDHLEPPMVEVDMERVREPREDMDAHGGGHSEEGSNHEASVSTQMHLEKLDSIKESVVAHADERLPNATTVEQRAVTLDAADRGPFIPPQMHPNVEEELRFLDLSADCVAVLGPFLTSHPTMRLNKPRLFCRSAYKCLWRFLLLAGSHPLSALLGDRRGDFTDFMDALTHFSFDPAWLDNLRAQVILPPSDDSPSCTLEQILLRKQQISVEMENLRLEMESLEQQESRLRSLLDAPLLRL